MKRTVAFVLTVFVWIILGWAVHKAVGGYNAAYFIIVTIVVVCQGIANVLREEE